MSHIAGTSYGKEQALSNEIITIPCSGGTYTKHESAYVDEGAEVGAGTRIWHFSHIMSGAVIGNGVKIQNNVSVYDDVIIEDEVFCGPSMVFTNVINPRAFVERKQEYKRTVVKRGASIGANATVVCGVTLGEYCFVGAGSVVTKDVPAYALVYGSPARQHGWVCKCGVILDETLKCPECGKQYKKIEDNGKSKIQEE